MVDVENGYFGTEINDKVYDITGDVTNKCNWKSWVDIDNAIVKKNITSKYMN